MSLSEREADERKRYALPLVIDERSSSLRRQGGERHIQSGAKMSLFNNHETKKVCYFMFVTVRTPVLRCWRTGCYSLSYHLGKLLETLVYDIPHL